MRSQRSLPVDGHEIPVNVWGFRGQPHTGALYDWGRGAPETVALMTRWARLAVRRLTPSYLAPRITLFSGGTPPASSPRSMKTRFLLALPFLVACTSPVVSSGDGGASSSSSGTTQSSGGGGGGPHASSCGPDLGTLSPALWGRMYDTNFQGLGPFQIAVDEEGESVLLASAEGVDFGTGEQVSGTALAAYDAAGAPLAAVSMNVAWAGGAHFHGTDLYTAGLELSTLDIVLEKRSAALASSWVKHVGVATQGSRVLTGPLLGTPDGNLILTGVPTSTSWQLGPTTLSFGDSDAFVVALDPEGGVLWAKQLGLVLGAPTNGDYAIIRAATVDPSGAIVIAGAKENPGLPDGVSHAFVAKLDSTGAILWSRVLPSLSDVGGAEIVGLAIAPNGSVIAEGGIQGTVDLGDGPISTGPSWVRFVARYDPAGALAKLVTPADGCAVPILVGRAPNGDIAVVGAGVKGALYAGTLDPESLAPSYTRGYAISARLVMAAAIAPSGSLVVSGDIDGPSDFGQGVVAPNAKLGEQPFLAALP